MTSMRSWLSALLILVGLVAGTIAVPALWVQRQMVDTEQWVSTLAPLIADDEVQREVTVALVDAIDSEGDLPRWGREAALVVVGELVATETFARVWAEGIETAHVELVAAMRDESDGLSVDEAAIEVDLEALFGVVQPALVEAEVPLAGLIPAPEGTVVLDNSAETVKVLRAAALVDAWALPGAVSAAVSLAAGILISRRRARSMAATGALVALLGTIALWLVSQWRAQWVTAGASGVGDVVVELLTDSAMEWAWMVAAGGAVALVLGAIAVVWAGRTAS